MELGNIVFGHSRGEYVVPRDWEDVMWALQDKLKENSSPYGTAFENDTFVMRTYYWGNCSCEERPDGYCECSLPNFEYKPGGYRLMWYKYALRDSYANQRITKAQFNDMIAKCIESIK